jgi:hypothetical protein
VKESFFVIQLVELKILNTENTTQTTTHSTLKFERSTVDDRIIVEWPPMLSVVCHGVGRFIGQNQWRGQGKFTRGNWLAFAQSTNGGSERK